MWHCLNFLDRCCRVNCRANCQVSDSDYQTMATCSFVGTLTPNSYSTLSLAYNCCLLRASSESCSPWLSSSSDSSVVSWCSRGRWLSLSEVASWASWFARRTDSLFATSEGFFSSSCSSPSVIWYSARDCCLRPELLSTYSIDLWDSFDAPQEPESSIVSSSTSASDGVS